VAFFLFERIEMMKFSFVSLLTLMLLAFTPRPAAAAPVPEDEQQLIQVLTSTASPREKDAACEKLKHVGTRRCVPAVSALLLDQQLSDSARYVLEAMPIAEAGQALLTALPQASGLIQIGIINSLGVRGETRATPALARLLTDPDPAVAAAAARALGQIGDPGAVNPLQSFAQASSGPAHAAAVDGLLRCANRLIETGLTGQAEGIFEALYATEKADAFRQAAYRGMIRSSGQGGLALIIRAIEQGPPPARVAAVQMAREIQVPGATAELCRVLPRVGPDLQIALIGGLAQRGDPSAAPALEALISRAAPEVRITILNALGTLGDASQVLVPSQFAASGTAAEQVAARQALIDLRRGNVGEELVSQLATSIPEVKAELARALGDRGEHNAVPRLVDLAQKGPGSVRAAALKALELLVDDSQLVPLVEFVLHAPDETSRAEAAEALNSACQRLAGRRGQANFQALVEGVQVGSSEARVALLPICSGLVSPAVQVALRLGESSGDPEVRMAACRALCDTVDPDLLPDVIALARDSKEENLRSLAITGGVRLASREETTQLSREQRVTALKALLGAVRNPEQKRVVLSGLAEVPDIEALRLVEGTLDDTAVHNEATRAAIKIAVTLPSAQGQEALAVLNKALAETSDGPTRQACEAAVKQIQDSLDYITDWMVAGPYSETGKDYAALFDSIFPPETGESKGVRWKPLPAGTDPKRPHVLDLLKAVGGEQCVAYVRTWINTEQERPLQLQMSTDDGVKVWLNQKQVYANNAARPLQPGSDKVEVTLHPGWNMLLLKVTQNNLAWEFCVRMCNPDGSHPEGLKVQAAPQTD